MIAFEIYMDKSSFDELFHDIAKANANIIRENTSSLPQPEEISPPLLQRYFLLFEYFHTTKPSPSFPTSPPHLNKNNLLTLNRILKSFSNIMRFVQRHFSRKNDVHFSEKFITYHSSKRFIQHQYEIQLPSIPNRDIKTTILHSNKTRRREKNDITISFSSIQRTN